MSYLKAINQNPRTLFGIIHYAKDERENSLPPIAAGLGVFPDTAFEEMDAVKQIYNKTGGRQYKHFMFSFDSNVSLSHEMLMEIGHKIGSYFSREYQVAFYIHFDKNNIHIHYILNTVNMFNGQKFRISKRDFYNYKLYINEILLSYNLSPIDLYDDDHNVFVKDA
jgi:hypothetical protein